MAPPNMKKLLLVLLAAVCVVPVFAQKLVIKGSDTLGAKLVPTLKETYAAAHPGVSFEIAAEGSTTGITAIIEGTAQIGMSSREASATEKSSASAKGVTLTPTEVAYDGLAVIVHASSPLTQLTLRQVEQIFTGDITDWSAVGGRSGAFSLYTRNTSSGTYADFRNLAMARRDYATAAQKLAGNEQIAAEVAKNPLGIGYVGLAYTSTPGIKVVAINGVLPDQQSVLQKRYPLGRPNFFYTNGAPAGATKEFVDFVLSPAGQKIVEAVGFVPVK
jgi:phosphate transport system substrate-binding protein